MPFNWSISICQSAGEVGPLAELTDAVWILHYKRMYGYKNTPDINVVGASCISFLISYPPYDLSPFIYYLTFHNSLFFCLSSYGFKLPL